MVRPIVLFSVVSLGTLLLDQISKYFIQQYQPDWSFSFINIIFLKNSGAGFGILPGQHILLGIISVAVIVLVAYNYQKLPKEVLPQLFAGFFLGGVMGNALDRLLRGYVVDFISLGFWPAFNLADAAITVGAIGLIMVLWKK